MRYESGWAAELHIAISHPHPTQFSLHHQPGSPFQWYNEFNFPSVIPYCGSLSKAYILVVSGPIFLCEHVRLSSVVSVIGLVPCELSGYEQTEKGDTLNWLDENVHHLIISSVKYITSTQLLADVRELKDNNRIDVIDFQHVGTIKTFWITVKSLH